MPCLLYADSRGEIHDFPELQMAGRSAAFYVQPKLDELIPLPEGSELFLLPNRYPVGIDPSDKNPAQLTENPSVPGDGLQAVAAFISPAHTANHLAAFQKDDSSPKDLPLFAYTAVGWLDGEFWVSAFRSDLSNRQDFSAFSQDLIIKKTSKALEANPNNRLIQHLGKCSLTYGCPAAKNLFLRREEAPLPTSPVCNASCIGCISLQPSGCCPSTQDRINFVPTAEEICQVAAPHLQGVEKAVVSFGQGCEGEPTMQADTISAAIRKIRKITSKGTINCNTNAGLTVAVEELANAGLDSMRVSMNSAQESLHSRYYRPKGFSISDVKESIAVMKKKGKFVSLNYFIFPGVSDSEEEYHALSQLLSDYRPDFIQLRNMNMDPDWYLKSLKFSPDKEAMGIQNWLQKIKKNFPELGFGYFNPALF